MFIIRLHSLVQAIDTGKACHNRWGDMIFLRETKTHRSSRWAIDKLVIFRLSPRSRTERHGDVDIAPVAQDGQRDGIARSGVDG